MVLRVDTAASVVGGLLFFVQLWAVLKRSGWRPLISQVRSASGRISETFRELLSSCAGGRTGDAVDDPLASVQQMMRDRQLALAHGFIHWFWVCTQVFMIGWLTTAWTNSNSYLTRWLEGLFIFVYGLIGILYNFPWMLNVKTLDMCCAVFMLCCILGVAPVDSLKTLVPLVSMNTIILRFFICLIGSNAYLIVGSNILYLAVLIFSYYYLPGDCDAQPELATFALTECWSTTLLVMGVGIVKELLIAEARLTLEAQTAKNEHSAVSSLLTTMSEAVVELDSELRIVGQSRQLASMLLHSQTRSLAGEVFSGFSASDNDKQRFLQHMTDYIAYDPFLAHVFHHRLRDCLHNVIKVEIFHIRVEGYVFHKSTRHLMGIREYGDTGPLSRSPNGGGRATGSAPVQQVSNCSSEVMTPHRRGQANTRDPAPVSFAADARGIAGPDSSSEGGSRGQYESSSNHEGGGIELVHIAFDATSFKIAECSPQLSELLRPRLEDVRFDEILKEGQQKALRRLVDQVSDLVASENARTISFSLGMLALRPEFAGDFSNCRADCFITLERKEDTVSAIALLSGAVRGNPSAQGQSENATAALPIGSKPARPIANRDSPYMEESNLEFCASRFATISQATAEKNGDSVEQVRL